MGEEKIMSNIWFTADTHAYHQKILRYCNRPWDNVLAMTEELARNINDCLPAKSMLYHLGDFCYGNKIRTEGFRSMINCGRIVLVLGNHDKLIRKKKDLHKLFEKICDIEELNLQKRQKIVLCHYAMRRWNAASHGSWQLYGHSHGTLPDDPSLLSFDIGVDCWDYKPISLEQVQEKMEEKGKLNATRHY